MVARKQKVIQTAKTRAKLNIVASQFGFFNLAPDSDDAGMKAYYICRADTQLKRRHLTLSPTQRLSGFTYAHKCVTNSTDPNPSQFQYNDSEFEFGFESDSDSDSS